MFLFASFWAACLVTGASATDQDGRPISAGTAVASSAAMAALGVSHFFL